MTLTIGQDRLLAGTELFETTDRSLLRVPVSGGGLELPELRTTAARYLCFGVEAHEDHSAVLNLHLYAEGRPVPFTVRFGVLPRQATRVCLDLTWTDGATLFPEADAGALKLVCHGARIDRAEIVRATLDAAPSHHEQLISFWGLELCDDRPDPEPLVPRVLVDRFGQAAGRTWPGKVVDEASLRLRLTRRRTALGEAFPFEDWDEFGGCRSQPLAAPTGFFRAVRHGGRWKLADPLGNAFFSQGPDCVGVPTDCRIDGTEALLEWLPRADDPEFGGLFRTTTWPPEGLGRRTPRLFSFEGANLRRAFGAGWRDDWAVLLRRELKAHGLNSLGNWSDPAGFAALGLPFVVQLPEFPTTRRTIFRDFPDVFSPEYTEDAHRCARLLARWKGNSRLIGYFLRNEPAWAFVDGLILADEVLFCPEATVTKDHLIAWLQERYPRIGALNTAWGTAWASFDDLRTPRRDLSRSSPQAERDLRAFSRLMLEAYVGIPSRACRAVDPDHMNLGMRWAWISDPDLVTGWEHFDVFSINCYAFDPTEALDRVAALGVDRPVLIGEFHFGALDRGPSATGLKGVRTQKDRGRAYRFYTERVAAHPAGVGCHFFQCYDQFALGRFDGENYNIGFFDVASQPHVDLLRAVKTTAGRVYGLMDGSLRPTRLGADPIPMIAY